MGFGTIEINLVLEGFYAVPNFSEISNCKLEQIGPTARRTWNVKALKIGSSRSWLFPRGILLLWAQEYSFDPTAVAKDFDEDKIATCFMRGANSVNGPLLLQKLKRCFLRSCRFWLQSFGEKWWKPVLCANKNVGLMRTAVGQAAGYHTHNFLPTFKASCFSTFLRCGR